MTCMFKASMNGEERDVHPRFLHVHPKTPLLIREGGGFGYAKTKFPPNLGGNMNVITCFSIIISARDF